MDSIISGAPLGSSSLSYQLIGNYTLPIITKESASFYLCDIYHYDETFSLIDIFRNYINGACVITELSSICYDTSDAQSPSYGCSLVLPDTNNFVINDDSTEFPLQDGYTVTTQSSYEWIRNNQEYLYFPLAKLLDRDVRFTLSAHIFQKICFNTANVKLYGIPKSAVI